MAGESEGSALIVGGGLAGLSLALALAREGVAATLVDPAPAPRGAGFDGRAYALAHASVRLLRNLGVWPALAAEAQPILAVKVADGRPGEPPSPLHLAFDAAEIEEGPLGHMVEDRHLRPTLEAAVEAAGVRLLRGARVVAQEVGPAWAVARLEDGRRIAAALIVGCDGRDGGTARRAGIRRLGHAYGQTAITCAVAHERPHRGTAHQLFLPSGPLAVLPLRGERSSIVWSERTARAEWLLGLPEDGFMAALRLVLGDFLGGLAPAGRRWGYPLALSFAQSLVAPRVALVGDAAHGLHPIAGQGLNAGLRDVAALAAVLSEARGRGEDPGAPQVLARYQRWRRWDNLALALATDGFNRLFSNDSALLRPLRDLGLAAVNGVAPLRRALLREAAGLAGDLPPLLR
jgi:2-octaprenyl-6-methoxyphenol hydroxylase